MNLIFINCENEIKYFIQNSLTHHYIPIVCDLNVIHLLERDKIEYINIWDFISNDEIQLNWKLSNELPRAWGEFNIEDELKYSVCGDLFYSIQTALNTSTIFKKIFTQNEIEIILLFEKSKIGVLRGGPNPMNSYLVGISNSVIKYISKSYNVEVVNINLLDRNTEFNFNNKKTDSFIINYNTEENGNSVLIFEEMFSGKDKLAVIKYFQEKSWNIYIVNNSILDGILFDSEINTDILSDFFTSNSNGKVLADYPEIFNNDFLNYQFEAVIRELEFSKNRALVFKKLLLNLNPTVVIFGHDNFINEYILTIETNRLNFESISFIHGIFGSKINFDSSVGCSNSFLAYNSIFKEIFPNKSANIHPIGDLFTSYFRKNLINHIPDLRNNIIKKILIITSPINSHLSVPIASANIHLKFYEELKIYANRNLRISFYIKPHPGYDHYDFYKNYIGNNIYLIKDSNLNDVIDECNLILMPNCITSAALDCFLKRKPLIFFNNAIYDLPDWRFSIPSLEDFELSNFTDLELFIQNYEKSLLFRKNYSLKLEKVVNSFLFNNNLKPQDLFDIFVEKLMKKRTEDIINQEDFFMDSQFDFLIEAYVKGYDKNIEQINFELFKSSSNNILFLKYYFLGLSRTIKYFYFFDIIKFNKFFLSHVRYFIDFKSLMYFTRINLHMIKRINI